uniref:Predicted nuclease of the RNAse H fold, HicB family n=1 Tax=Candidatus Kentrum sp. FW TaxID=2126338 RepID=A0A450U453_9GAMM|nr:MAG: Predicted nuclease of the RNAse H fold, HicB family [Candidatus Kentron sp. FW]
MNTLSHRGYTARIEYDERDNIFVGRVLGIRSIISFHAGTVARLRGEFENSIDDYLAECGEDGFEPEKPAPEMSSHQIPPAMRAQAPGTAQTAGKPLDQWTTETLEHVAHA